MAAGAGCSSLASNVSASGSAGGGAEPPASMLSTMGYPFTIFSVCVRPFAFSPCGCTPPEQDAGVSLPS